MTTRYNNVFVLGTEYHFLMAMFIIEENFQSTDYHNKLVFLGKRLSQINTKALPGNISTVDFVFDQELDPKRKLKEEILNVAVDNLFMVNVYRPADTFIVSSVPARTKRHIMQDGSLFYHRIEKAIIGNRIKETYRIYSSLWKKGIFFTDVLWYGRFMEASQYVDEVWMTNPKEYVGPKTRKPINIIQYFSGLNSIDKMWSYFSNSTSQRFPLDGYLIYLSPIIREVEHVEIEIEQIRRILNFFDLKKVMVKLHPNTSDFHFNRLTSVFGNDVVVKNYVPAELYIAKATNSVIVGCASTSLFYNNPSNRYFGLKGFFQRLGIYAEWKNINLPPHVKQVQEIEDIVR